MRGGRRAGSGRKPTGRRYQIGFQLDPDVIQRLRAEVPRGERNQFVGGAITAKLDTLPKGKTLVEVFANEQVALCNPSLLINQAQQEAEKQTIII